MADRDWPSDPGSSDNEGGKDDGGDDRKGPGKVDLPKELNGGPEGKEKKGPEGKQGPSGDKESSSLSNMLKKLMEGDGPSNELARENPDLPSSSKDGGLRLLEANTSPDADAPSTSDVGTVGGVPQTNESVPRVNGFGGLGGPANKAPARADSPAMGMLDRLMDKPPEDWEKPYEEQFYANIAASTPVHVRPLAVAKSRKHKAWERDANGRRALLSGRLMPPVKNFGEAVRRLLQGCKGLRTLELPYGKVAHFSGGVRHARLETLKVKGMADVAYCKSLRDSWCCRRDLV